MENGLDRRKEGITERWRVGTFTTIRNVKFRTEEETVATGEITSGEITYRKGERESKTRCLNTGMKTDK